MCHWQTMKNTKGNLLQGVVLKMQILGPFIF